MKQFKKVAGFLALTSFLFASTPALEAEVCYTGGSAYRECTTCPSLTPAIALGAIALVAIIAVAVQNSNNEHGHSHLSS